MAVMFSSDYPCICHWHLLDTKRNKPWTEWIPHNMPTLTDLRSYYILPSCQRLRETNWLVDKVLQVSPENGLQGRHG